MKITRHLALAVLGLLWAMPPAKAQTATWTNLAGGVWSDALNWNPNTLPGNSALVTVAGAYVITQDVNATVGTLRLNANSPVLGVPPGVWLTVTNTGGTGGNENNGLSFNGGNGAQLAVAGGTVTNRGFLLTGSAGITISNGGSMAVLAGTPRMNDRSRLVLNGGTLRISPGLDFGYNQGNAIVLLGLSNGAALFNGTANIGARGEANWVVAGALVTNLAGVTVTPTAPSGTFAQTGRVTVAGGQWVHNGALSIGATTAASENRSEFNQTGGEYTNISATANVTVGLYSTGSLAVAGGNFYAVGGGNFYVGNTNAAYVGEGYVTNRGGLMAVGRVEVRNGLWVIDGGSVSADTISNHYATGQIDFRRGSVLANGMVVSNGAALTVGDGANAAWLSLTGSKPLSFVDGVNVAAGSALVVTNPAAATLASVVGGAGTFVKSDVGTLALAGTNTYTGVTDIFGGVLNVAVFSDYGVDGGLGNRALASEVAAGDGIGIHLGRGTTGATLQYTGSTPQSTDRQIRISNANNTIDASGAGAGTLSFTWNQPNVNLFDTPGTRTLTLAGSNTGDNRFGIWLTDQGANKTSLTKTGAGTWVITGTGNTYSGNVTVNNGRLRIVNNTGLGTGTKTVQIVAGASTTPELHLDGSAGNLTLAAGIGFRTSQVKTAAIFNDAGDNTINGALTLTSGNGSTYIHSAAGRLTLAGPITILAGQTSRGIELRGAGDGRISGAMSDGSVGVFSLTMAGSGTWDVAGASTYAGPTVVNSGTLLVNNAAGSGTGSGAVTVNGGTLGGTGTIAGVVTVASGATFAAGNSVGTNIVGSLTLTPGSTFEVEADGAAADQTISLGPVDLGGATLSTVEINPATFTSALILSNATGQITGHFAGLGESAPVMIGTTMYFIHYRPTYVELNLSPTAVVLHQFGAIAEGAGVVVRWRTASEVRTAGFDLYRKAGDEWVKVNDATIAAAGALQGGIGASYAVTDAGAAAGGTYEYKLVEIEHDGTRREYGPYERTATAFEMTSPIRATPEGMEIRWLSRAGERYRVLRASELRKPSFEAVAGGLDATPPENVFVDTNTAPLRVYRVELEE